MQETISLFTEKYGLTRSEVIGEIEKVFSGVFSRRYGFEVMVVLQPNDHLDVVAYKRFNGVLLQKSIDVTRIRGWNTIKRHLEKNLLKASVLKQSRQYKYYERELRWGEITAVDSWKNYHVELEVVPGETVTVGSLLTKRAAYTAGKVIISMIQAFVGRVYSSGKNVTPSLVMHIDEAQSVLYHGIEDLFAKAGGAGVYIHGYCQSISQLHAEVGEDRANTILDNCNTKLFMRVPDASTALYVSRHLGEQHQFSPIISVGGGLSIRETEDVRIKHTEILNMAPRELFLSTYSGTYKGKTATVQESKLKVKFPDLARLTMGS